MSNCSGNQILNCYCLEKGDFSVNCCEKITDFRRDEQNRECKVLGVVWIDGYPIFWKLQEEHERGKNIWSDHGVVKRTYKTVWRSGHILFSNVEIGNQTVMSKKNR